MSAILAPRRRGAEEHVHGKTTSRQRGFTLFELLVITAIIAAIAAIAIPNMIESRKAANESAAIGDMRTLFHAQELFKQRDASQAYAPTFAALAAAGLLDSSLGSGSKSGYLFAILASDPWQWSAEASPMVPARSGDRYFWIDESGLIRAATGRAATVADPAVGG
jgi:prepilin-type N-terminal cleavage/methylation domain-containing protein